MKDLLGNELHIGDKVVYAEKRSEKKNLDYGIIKNFTQNGDKCYCDSVIHPEYTWKMNALRESRQIVKIS